MKLALARGWLPAVVTYSDELPEEVGVMVLTCFVVLRTKYRDDKGLHEHALEQVAQWYAVAAATLLMALFAYVQGESVAALGLALASVGMYGLLYRRWRKFRLISEAQAFARQMRFPDRKGDRLSLEQAARLLCSARYGLNLSSSEAAEIIGDKHSG